MALGLPVAFPLVKFRTTPVTKIRGSVDYFILLFHGLRFKVLGLGFGIPLKKKLKTLKTLQPLTLKP
jgi:hypothetical protein